MSDTVTTEPTATENGTAPIAAAPAPVIAPEPTWRDSLPEDLKADPSLSTLKDVGALAKSYVEIRKTVGKDGVRVPKEDAPPEEWAKFHQALGVPETPDKYELPEIEGIQFNEKEVSEFKSLAHKLGLRPEAVKQLAQFDAIRAQKLVEAQDTRNAQIRKSTEEALAAKWGPKGSPIYQRELAKARWAARAVAQEDGAIAEYAEKLGETPEGVRFLAALAGMVGEEQGFAAQLAGGLNPTDAQIKLDAMMTDRKGPAWDAMHKDHESTLLQMVELRRIIDADKGRR